MDDKADSAASPDGSRDEAAKMNRACDFCHRMKMKCIGKENPPCNRCRASRQSCTFDGPRKSKGTKVEDRLKVVEEQMSEVQSSLAELLQYQRAAAASTPRPVSTPAPPQSEPSHRTGVSALEPPLSIYDSPAAPSSSRGFWNNNTSPSAPHSPIKQAPAAPPVRQAHAGHSNGSGRTSPGKGYDMSRPWSSRGTPHRHEPSPAHLQEAESGMPSDDEDDDPLEPHAIIYNNMLSLAEAARLKADGHLEENDRPPRKRDARGREQMPFDFTVDAESRKRPRRDDGLRKSDPLLQRGNHVHAFKHPIELGFCSEAKGRQLFQIFMDGAAVYVPIFEPGVDTWESLLLRSPFSVTVLMYVGAKIEDAGGQPSVLQNKLKDHAEKIGMHTLFTPVARIEVLQGMIILASWGDTSWRPGGHALRIAMDMGLYRCLPFLAETGMGAGKTAAELQDERHLVVGARCWLALYKSEFEMAFNLGRPALFAAEETLSHGRKFLDHPLAIQTDSRLVATCELLTLRLSMHQPFSIWAAATRMQNLDERIEQADNSYAVWYKYWESYYIDAGVQRSNILRESLLSQYSHARLHTNSRILHSVRSRRDVALLSEKRHILLVNALRSAETLVGMALRGSAYASNFVKGNYYTHVGIAFAARMLIRLTSLIPEEVDIRQTGRDLEALTKRLAQVPGFQFAQQLREIIVKARRRHFLPPSSKAPSRNPSPGPDPGPEDKHNRGQREPYLPVSGSHPTPALSPANAVDMLVGSATGTTPENIALDFFYAEQLFTTTGADGSEHLKNDMPPMAGTGTGTPALIDPVFSLDSWFPYPPLESDSLDLGGAAGDMSLGGLGSVGNHDGVYW